MQNDPGDIKRSGSSGSGLSASRAFTAQSARGQAGLLADGWPATGLLRIAQIIGVGRLPISKSQFWILVREKGLQPVKLSPRVTCFWVHELRAAFFGSEPTAGDDE